MIAVRDRVRFEETDLMGVVYHARYLPWLEIGRVAYLRRCGVDLNELMADGIVTPILEVNLKYRSSARFDDEFEVRATLKEFNRAKMLFAYQVVRVADGQLFLEGTTLNAFTSKEGQIIRLPRKWFYKINSAYLQEKERNGGEAE